METIDNYLQKKTGMWGYPARQKLEQLLKEGKNFTEMEKELGISNSAVQKEILGGMIFQKTGYNAYDRHLAACLLDKHGDQFFFYQGKP